MSRKHRIFFGILRVPVWLFLKLRFGFRYQKAPNLSESYIVLSNHVTDLDPLFLGVSFPHQMYFVASEHITRWKLAYAALRFVFEPIIRYKGSIAASTVMDILRKVRKGGRVCIFAEGMRTWDGATSPIVPSTAKLIKASRCALVTYKLVGGYFVSPNWSKKMRRGPISGAPVRVYSKEELARMSEVEIYDAISKDLYEDAYVRQLADSKPYKSRHGAEFLENMFFLCPTCRANGSLHSKGDTVTCASCGLQFKYNSFCILEGIPFQTVKDYSNWQIEMVREDVTSNAVYRNGEATLSTVADHIPIPLAHGATTISCERLTCGDWAMPLAQIPDLAIHGRHSLVFSAGGEYFELTVPKQYNIYKFFVYYREWKRQKLISAKD